MTKYLLVDLKHNDNHECDSIDAMIDVCRDLNINSKTSIAIRMDDGCKPYIVDLTDAAKSRLYIDVAIRFQTMFGLKNLSTLYDMQNLINAVRQDVIDSSEFNDRFMYNDDDISMAITRVFNLRLNPVQSESERLKKLHKDCALDVVACVADNTFRIIDMDRIADYNHYDLFSIYNRVTWIACECAEAWEKLTEEEQDDIGWLAFIDERSSKMINEKFANEIEWQKENAK